MQVCKNSPHCSPLTLTAHLLLHTCPVQGRREPGCSATAPGLLGEGCSSLSQNMSPIPRGILTSRFPGDRNPPGNHSSPSFPCGNSRRRAAPGMDQRLCPRAHRPCGQTGANRLSLRQEIIKRTGEGRRDLFSMPIWWEQQSHGSGVWQSPGMCAGTWGVRGFGMLRGSPVCTHQP